jgi:hypothetical protein
MANFTARTRTGGALFLNPSKENKKSNFNICASDCKDPRKLLPWRNKGMREKGNNSSR